VGTDFYLPETVSPDVTDSVPPPMKIWREGTDMGNRIHTFKPEEEEGGGKVGEVILHSKMGMGGS